MPRTSSKKPQLGELALHQLPGQLLTEEDVQSERWYEAQPDWPETRTAAQLGSQSQCLQIATEALASASHMFEKRTNTSTQEVRNALGKEKTLGDKVAAYALAVQETPVFRLDELRTLLSFAQSNARQERSDALQALKDLFVNDLLPDGRRLVSITQRDFSCDRKLLTKRHLVYALFESELKSIYREFLQVLEDGGRDSIKFFKQKAVKLIFELLLAKPENEKTLLSMLVNKLGDPDRTVSSTAAYNLSQLIQVHHPQMRSIVVREVEQMLFRPNINRQAQYYSIAFLNQVSFRHADVELARHVVRIYLDVFSRCLAEDAKSPAPLSKPAKPTKVKLRWRNKGRKKPREPKKDEAEEMKHGRLMAALLLGVNRAFPFTKPEQDDTTYDKYYDSLFRIAHANSLGPATQAIALLLQISQTNSVQNDRLYRALYSRIHDAVEGSEKVQASFLNVVFKAMKADTNTKRVKAFLKRLLQAGSYASSGFAGACMVVVSECFHRSQKGLLKSFLSLPERDDEEEIFFDADKLEDANDEALDKLNDDSSETESHRNDNDLEGDIGKAEVLSKAVEGVDAAKTAFDYYDPWKRDPLFAGAEKSSLWEAVSLSAHYHPSVSQFASSVCKDMKGVENTGDPLRDYSLIAFLDRFCYKRAKNRVAKSLYGKRSTRYRDDPVANSLQFQHFMKSGNVGEDDKFLMKFFEKNPDRVAQEGDGDDDNYHSGSDIDSEEEAFEEALQEEMRRLGADESLISGDGGLNRPDMGDMDEDEMKAFEEAFGKDMVGSDREDADKSGEEDGDEDGLGNGDVDGGSEVTMLPMFADDERKEDDENDKAGSDADDESDGQAKSKKKRKRKDSLSVFAAAEDYEQVIDLELKDAEKLEDEGGSTRAKASHGDSLSHRKRRRSEPAKRSRKKRCQRTD